MTDHQHVQMLVQRVPRERHRRVRRRREHVRFPAQPDDVRRVTTAGSLGVVRVDRPSRDRGDGVLDEAGLVERVRVNRDLHVELVGHPEAAIDGRRRRSPILVELQSDRAAPDLFPKGGRVGGVPFSQEPEVHRERLGRLVHAAQVPRSRGARRRFSARRGSGAAPDERCQAGEEGIRNLRGRDEVHVGVDASCGQQVPFTGEDFGRRADLEARRHAVHDPGIAGLADGRDPAVSDADVRLVDARAVDDDRGGDDEVGSAPFPGGTRGLPHSVANDLASAELGFLAVHRVIVLDADQQGGVAEPDSIPGRRPVVIRVGPPVDSHGWPAAKARAAAIALLRVCSSSSRPSTRPFKPYTIRWPPSATSSTTRVSPGSKRTAVPARMFSRMP